jgi:predicted phosphodiesterase
MKLNVLSDLHLGQGALAIPDNDADVVVLAGDIARPVEAVRWAVQLGKPVLYVPGNHEFYGGTISGTVSTLKSLCAGTLVRVLDDEEVVLEGVRFLGSTLWTDFRLSGDGDERAAAMKAAAGSMRDFSRIFQDAALQNPFTPADCARLSKRHAAWLARSLARTHDGPTVVVTHHAPSRRSVHPRFESSPLNACFVSDLDHLVDGRRAQLWIHGHTHDSFDYRLNGTRVVCNPRGYSPGGVNENASFDPDFTISIGSGKA